VAGAYGRFAYHAITFGWLADGLLRALTGGSLPDLFADYFARPFELDYHIGLPPSESARVATLALVEDPAAALADPDPEMTGKSLLRSANGVDYLHNLPLLNSADFHPVPQSACNGIGTAAGLAGVYAALLAGGRARENAVDRFTRAVLEIPGPGPRRHQGLGFQVRMPTPWNPTDTAFGHTGAGGGVAFLDPGQRLSFGYTTNHLVYGADDRLDRLRAALAADLLSRK
jgi:CubicO group peptidase (beta-lactamase class C family)